MKCRERSQPRTSTCRSERGRRPCRRRSSSQDRTRLGGDDELSSSLTASRCWTRLPYPSWAPFIFSNIRHINPVRGEGTCFPTFCLPPVVLHRVPKGLSLRVRSVTWWGHVSPSCAFFSSQQLERCFSKYCSVFPNPPWTDTFKKDHKNSRKNK